MKAFPSNADAEELGITILDYFAAKAMQALIQARWPREVEEREEICSLAYLIAEEMMEWRAEI
jgi:DNA-binding NtrC family response regulator